MASTACYIQNADVITQQVKDSTVLFDMASGHYYSINELGARAWELTDGTHPLSHIVSVIASEYDAPEEVIADDLRILYEQFRANGLIAESKLP